MQHEHWSPAEKRLARKVFEAAVGAELGEIVADFKRRAAAVASPDEMWELGDSLARIRREFDTKYDYRYSMLTIVLGRLVREGRVSIEQLQGLSEDKLLKIGRIVSL